jgi:ABC-type branched-subunit amino acid transport system substrate-binding protein
MRTRRAAFALVSTVLLVVGGCTSKGDHSADPASPGGVRLYGADGNTANSLGTAIKAPTTINGMVGTTPLTPLSDDFRQRLLAIDPSLTTFTYAGEAYDAAVISALAVQLARTTDPATVAKYINGVTILAPGGMECTTIKDCFDGIAAGRDIAYRGVTVHSGFTDAGEPSTTSYGTLHFGRDNKIDNGKTEFVSAGNNENATKLPSPAPGQPSAKYKGDPLKFGLLLPKTGQLAALGPPIFAGGHLAIKEMNDLGGVLGKPIEYEDADDGTDPVKAGAALDKLFLDGVGIVIGPSTSGESVALIPKAVLANRILFSPSATSAALTKADDHGLFFRTAPSDSYQSQALADVIMRGGARKVFIVARADSYGSGLLDGVTADLVTAGVKRADIGSRTYPADQKGYNYAEIAQAVMAFHPDAILVAGFEESAQVIEAMEKEGLTLAA